MRKGRGSTKAVEIAVARSRQLSTDEARSRLYPLINELTEVEDADASLVSHAIEIGPRRRGGAMLVPTIDIEAALGRISELEGLVEDLSQEREDLLHAAMVKERRTTPTEQLLSVDELASSIGRDDLITGS